MRVLSIPRDANPYQENLYGQMRAQGVEVEYLAELTPSATLNWLLLPLELVARRARGWRVIHIHWLYAFGAPLSSRFPVLGRLAHAWFRLWLGVAHRLGMTVVWTAHNTLPHSPIFDDDVAARRLLVSSADLVIGHSPEALAEVEGRLGRPRNAAVIPHGSFVTADETANLRTPGSDPGVREVLFFGRLLEYKGLDELAEAAAALGSDTPLRIRITGVCRDDELGARLAAHAARLGERLLFEPGFVDDADLADLFGRADGVVLPFRRITTSGSAEMALNHGRPLIVPDHPALRSLPDDAVLRYDPDGGLADALERFARLDARALARMSRAALEHSEGHSWQDIARATRELLAETARDAGRETERIGSRR